MPVRGLGMAIEDIDGNLFLDFAAGIAVNSTGHGHPRVVGAIKEQAADLIHYSASDFYLPIYAELAADDGADRADVGQAPDVPRQLGRRGGRGGDEAGPPLHRPAVHRRLPRRLPRPDVRRRVSLTASKAKYHARFDPLLPGIYHAPFGKVEDLKWFDDVLFNRLIPADEVAAMVIEPIQGEGGYIVPEDGFLQGLRELCTRHGILLVADEIQSGAGRTGKMWAIEHWGVEPDILLAAKGIAIGHADQRDGRAGRDHGALGRRRPRLDVRRQPGRVRGGARDDRAARGRARRQRRGAAATRRWPGCARSRRASRRPSSTSAARA